MKMENGGHYGIIKKMYRGIKNALQEIVFY
jgi:hypothetical protein